MEIERENNLISQREIENDHFKDGRELFFESYLDEMISQGRK